MYNLTVSEELKSHCPEYRGAAVYAEVINTPFSEGLWQEINAFTQELRAAETTEGIKHQPAIAATRCRESVTLRGAECVAKSYPGFWEDYCMLGGTIHEHHRT